MSTPAPNPEPTALPQSGLRYRPILDLGKGGMAEVKLAVGRGPGGFNKLSVLKTMHTSLAAHQEIREMFLAEARLSARLNHTNVVQVYEVVDAALPHIVMEYLEGQTMSAVQQAARQAFTTAMQLRVISAALSGLHYSHELQDYDGTPLNIVHRDISPQNIVVTYDGIVKVLDFGIAKTASAAGTTSAGVVKGKLCYMSREQLLGEPVDRRADIFAVGCMLWQAATGAKLWAGMRDSEVMQRLIRGDIPRPSARAQVDPRLEHLVMRALAPEANDRFATALELQDAIDEYLVCTETDVSMRDVSAFLSQLFEEQRHERSKIIHAYLSAPVSAPPEREELSSPRARNPASVLSAAGVEIPSERPSSRVWPVLVGGLALGLAAIAWFASAAEGERPPATALAQTPAAPASVRLRVSVIPREATLTLDGKALGGNPAEFSARLDASPHELRATAPGHVPLVTNLSFQRDTSLEFALTRLEPPPAASSGAKNGDQTPATARGSVRRATKPRAAARACDPPFYFDGGVKRYKPECL